MKGEAPEEKVFQGIPASPGLAQGPAFVFLQKELEVPLYELSSKSEAAEIKRFRDALQMTKDQVLGLRKQVAENLGESEAQIFDAHGMVLDDKALMEETIREHQKTSYNIEHCFQVVAKRYIEAFDKIDDVFIRERAADIKDVTKRVLANLLGCNAYNVFRFDEPKVIVSEDLSPSEAAEVTKESICALVTNAGSRTSHSVIMARSLQVPAVVGLHDATQQIENDDYIIVDGYEGVIIVNPSEETLSRYMVIKRERQKMQKVYEEVNPLPAKTKDGVRLSLMVNVGGVQDIRTIHTTGSDGIGLFRSEALFLNSGRPTSEEDQFKAYQDVVQGMKPLPVTIRTLDLGGDKRLNNLVLHEGEENPFMGYRAIRFCLEQTHIFKDQLRAILRASGYGKVRLMYPMISSVTELERANEILEECKQELRDKGQAFDENLEVGSMIETPAAALTIDMLAEHCSFFSIGTNDLIQYVLAVDRVNDRIAHLYQPHHPAVVRMLDMIIKAAKAKGVKVSVCGEMASDPIYSTLLLGLGAEALSVTPSSLPEIKFLIRNLDLGKAEQLAKELVKENSAKTILKRLREFYLGQVGNIDNGE